MSIRVYFKSSHSSHYNLTLMHNFFLNIHFLFTMPKGSRMASVYHGICFAVVAVLAFIGAPCCSNMICTDLTSPTSLDLPSRSRSNTSLYTLFGQTNVGLRNQPDPSPSPSALPPIPVVQTILVVLLLGHQSLYCSKKRLSSSFLAPLRGKIMPERRLPDE